MNTFTNDRKSCCIVGKFAGWHENDGFAIKGVSALTPLGVFISKSISTQFSSPGIIQGPARHRTPFSVLGCPCLCLSSSRPGLLGLLYVCQRNMHMKKKMFSAGIITLCLISELKIVSLRCRENLEAKKVQGDINPLSRSNNTWNGSLIISKATTGNLEVLGT